MYTRQAVIDRFFSKPQNNVSIIQENKDIIIQQALSNLGLSGKNRLSTAESWYLEEELEKIIYLQSGLPSFFDAYQDQKSDNNDNFQDPDLKSADKNGHTIHARNLLKHLVRGTPICDEDDTSHASSPLAKSDIIEILTKERDPAFMEAFRVEMQKLFNMAFKKLSSGQLDLASQRQYEMFQNTFISSYPFVDPPKDWRVQLPQKIGDKWEMIDYRFKRLDVSPKSGPLSWVLEERDHMYAFGLVPEYKSRSKNEESFNKKKEPFSYLLLPGTTYPSGQGSGVAAIYNYYPRHSAGEAHDMSEVKQWLDSRKDQSVKVVGHSKGATMAMIIAAKRSDKIVQADCLNPPALCGDTLERLAPAWSQVKKKARINVFGQFKDPCFPMEKGFLEGTNIYRVVSLKDQSAMNCSVPYLPKSIRKTLLAAYEAHISHKLGRKAVLLLKVNTKSENASKKREFLNNIKYIVNWLCFPGMYVGLCLEILARRCGAQAFYEKHKKIIVGFLMVATLLACGALAYTGVLAPFMALLVAAGLKTIFVYGVTAGLSIIASFLTPFLLKAVDLAVNIAISIAQWSTGLIVGSLVSTVKIGLKFIFSGFFREPLIAIPASAPAPVLIKRSHSSPALKNLYKERGIPIAEQKKDSVADLGKRISAQESPTLSPEKIIDNSLPKQRRFSS